MYQPGGSYHGTSSYILLQLPSLPTQFLSRSHHYQLASLIPTCHSYILAQDPPQSLTYPTLDPPPSCYKPPTNTPSSSSIRRSRRLSSPCPHIHKRRRRTTRLVRPGRRQKGGAERLEHFLLQAIQCSRESRGCREHGGEGSLTGGLEEGESTIPNERKKKCNPGLGLDLGDFPINCVT